MNIKIDFYRVDTSAAGEEPFEDLLARIGRLPDDDQRNQEVNRYPVRLSEYQDSGEYVLLDMTKIRMDQVPIVASLHGESREIELDEDEGIGEETAYLYHKSMGILLAQRNRYGVSASALASYIQLKLDLEGPIAFDPILTPDAYERLQTMPVVRKFEIKLAGVTNPEMMVGQNESTSFALERLNDYNAPNASIVFSMGHQRGSMNVRSIFSSARSWLSFSNENPNRVTSLRVSGEDPDNEREVIDLIADRFVDEREVVQTGRHVNWETRINILRASFDANQRALRRLFEDEEQ